MGESLTGVDQNQATSAARQILAALGDAPTLAQIIRAARKLDGIDDERVPVRFAVVRNITLEPILSPLLQIGAAHAGMNAQVWLSDFDSVERDVFDSSSALYSQTPDIIVFALHLQAMAPRLVLGFSALSPTDIAELSQAVISRIVHLVSTCRGLSNATILVHNFDQPAVPAYGVLDAQMQNGQRRTIAQLNERLANEITLIAGSYIVDVERFTAQLGYERAHDLRYWHIARAPYSLDFQRLLVLDYVVFARALKGRAKKCLVLDCDNTLWGGVIGEDGIDGIALGATSPGSAFVEMQAAVLNFYERGVLLALASKNNEPDVIDVFRSHPASLLRPENFVAKRVNWRDKASNLREIAAELNIGLDSLVFVDDNPFECNYVRDVLPEVTVVQLPSDPSGYAALIAALPYFDMLTLTAEDRRRSEMYRASASRDSLRASSGSLSTYLRSLQMKLTIGLADAFAIPRIAQLTQKTNQFNLTTRRYSEADVMAMAADPLWRCYYAEVNDRFDHAGIIAVALVHDERAATRIDSFLMSCRVIGRGIEFALMRAIADDCVMRGVTSLRGEYLPTAKNEPSRSLLPDCGFQDTSGDGRSWSLDLTRELPSAPTWFEAITRKELQLT